MRVARFLLVATVLFAVGGSAAAQEWPRFRGPNGSGVSTSTGLPAEFGPAKNVVWKTAVPFGRSSPVVAGERIYLTASDGQNLIVLCLKRADGSILWRREVTRARTTPIYKANDAASPSPVTDGKNVYAFFPDLGLISFDAKGKERWRAPLGPFNSFYGLAASPILAGNTLLMLCDARTNPFLIAVDAGTGKTRWRVERKDTRFEGYATPVLYEPKGGPAQVIVLGANRLDAYSVKSGEHLWWLGGLGYFPVASPVVQGDLLIANTYGSDAPEGPTFDEFLKSDADKNGRLSREEMKSSAEMYEHFNGVDVNMDGYVTREEWDAMRNGAVGEYGMVAARLGGRGDVTKSAVVWRDKKVYNSMPSLLVYNDVLYVSKNAGIIAAFNPASGAPLKVERPKDPPGEYFASPVAADGKVYFVGSSGKIVVLKAGPQWEFLAINDMAEECEATPAIAGSRLFIRTKSALYSFGAK